MQYAQTPVPDQAVLETEVTEGADSYNSPGRSLLIGKAPC